MPTPEYTPGTPEWIARRAAIREEIEDERPGLIAIDRSTLADGELLRWNAADGVFEGVPERATRLARTELTAPFTMAAGVGETAANIQDISNWNPLAFAMPDVPVKLRIRSYFRTDASGLGRSVTYTLRDTADPFTARAQWTLLTPSTAATLQHLMGEFELRPGEHFAVGAAVALKPSLHITAGTDTAVTLDVSALNQHFLVAELA